MRPSVSREQCQLRSYVSVCSKCPLSPVYSLLSVKKALITGNIEEPQAECQSVAGENKKKESVSHFLFTRPPSFLIRIPPFPSFNNDYLLRALSSNTVTLGARTSIDEFRGNTIQSKAGRLVPLTIGAPEPSQNEILLATRS